MIDPDTMQAWAESDQRRAADARAEALATGRGGNTGHTVTLVSAAGAGSWSSNVPPPRTDAEALEIRLLLVIHTEVGELRSRVHRLEGVVVPELRAEVARLSRLHPVPT